MQANQPPFDQSPEAQEYVQKLQQGRTELPNGVQTLEQEALKNLRGLQQQLRQTATTIGDIETDIETLKQRRETMIKNKDMIAGEMTGYAKLLVSAEGTRRAPRPESTDVETERSSAKTQNVRKQTVSDENKNVVGDKPRDPAKTAKEQNADDKQPVGKLKIKSKPKLRAVSEAVAN